MPRYKLRTLMILLAVGPPLLAAPWLILAYIDGFLLWCLTVALIVYWPWIVVAILLGGGLAWSIYAAARNAIRLRATLHRYHLHTPLIVLALGPPVLGAALLLSDFAVEHWSTFDVLLWGFLFLTVGLIIGAQVLLGIHRRQRVN